MILSVTLNPCVDHTFFVEGLKQHDTNRITRTETDAGGKGVNLSRIVAELGGDTVASGFLGGDTGRYVQLVLEKQGVGHDFVESRGETRTNVTVESGDGPPTVFSAPGPTASEEEVGQMLDKLVEWAGRASWIALGGSLPPGADPGIYARMGVLTREKGVKWALDADGRPLSRGMEAGPDFVKPNHHEAGRVLETVIGNLEDALRAARELRVRLSASGSGEGVAVVSMGGQGAAMACAEGEFIGEAIQVVARSTVGSGDSMIGAMLLRSSEGASWSDALRWGLAAGAATAMTDGTQIGRRADIERLVPSAVVRTA